MFALAMIGVLAAAGVFVYLRLRTDLDDRVNASLQARAEAAAGLAKSPGGLTLRQFGVGGFDEKRETFAQVLTPTGLVLDATGGPRRPVLTAAEIAQAATGTTRLERKIPTIDGTARLLARPLSDGPESTVLVVGQSLDDRDEALRGVVHSFAVGGPGAVVLASILGYGLAAAAFRPIEAMRRRAGEIALGNEGHWLPLPPAHDEVRRLGETLNDMLDRLRAALVRERRFVADASHELRTPLAVVKTELENALRADDGGPHVREALVAAVDECDSLIQLAEDLLVLARVEGGELAVRRERLEVDALLEAARDRFSDRAGLNGRSIRVDGEAGLVVMADELRLRQALANLLDNALRHGEGEVVLTARYRNRGVALAVADHGPGFRPDIQERAFERFTRGEHERRGEGSGLGLAIVRSIAEAHGGTASVGAGPGAAVELWLPPVAPHEPARSQGGLRQA